MPGSWPPWPGIDHDARHAQARAAARSRIRPRRSPTGGAGDRRRVASGGGGAGARRWSRCREPASSGRRWRLGRFARSRTIGSDGGYRRRCTVGGGGAGSANASRTRRRRDDDGRGRGTAALGIDHQAERAVEREHAVLRDVLEIEHDAHGVVGMAADADLVDDVAAVGQHLVHQRRRQLDVPQVEEHPRRTGQPLFAIGHLLDRARASRARCRAARRAESTSASPVPATAQPARRRRGNETGVAAAGGRDRWRRRLAERRDLRVGLLDERARGIFLHQPAIELQRAIAILAAD